MHVVGKLKGGYTTQVLTETVAGAFNPDKLATRGNLGSYDVTDKPTFASYGLNWTIDDIADWGWVYETENNGSWVNASNPPGNSGDITG